ncbi:Glycosyltransferase involved in cell wall bisynthesis [Thermoflexibacter ruber]|uniref:Glycosyltransferase involved in cell wall bisynthesis n=2 Tax=Thermoflexibacter ruber TaxID=1003 RepID=A0A1I2EC65_9BACT|nr:Glycosyltransferase involved in cell wall bisynthesis [Thermoflexibacter ruber]
MEFLRKFTLMKKIAIASVLKPVDDVRMYEKFALSIAKLFPNGYEIHILGAASSKVSDFQSIDNIFFYPIARFDRLDNKRWKYSQVFLQYILKIKPDLLIINSPELLLPSLFVKLYLKTPIIYDVRENYFRNIWYQPTYPFFLRFPLAIFVRALEYVSRLWIDFYLLAEKNYEKEFSFSKGKSQVIENKYKRLMTNDELLISNQLTTNNKQLTSNIQHLISSTKHLTFLYTGTISYTYGTHRAIEFIEKIREYLPDSQLIVKGFCSDKKYRALLEKEVIDSKFIHLEISNVPLNHQEIINAFAKADIALLPYLPNKSTENCIPAKLYEYIAHQVPMIVQFNPLWQEVCHPCNAALFIDFKQFDIERLVKDLGSFSFYSEGSTAFVWWENEEAKLRQVIERFV